MIEVRTAHTADLDATVLTAVRALLDDAFHGDMSDHDWEHSLGGIHALVWEHDEVIGHASVVQRRLLHGGRALRAGYIEGVGVRVNRRRRGHGAAMPFIPAVSCRPPDRGAAELQRRLESGPSGSQAAGCGASE